SGDRWPAYQIGNQPFRSSGAHRHPGRKHAAPTDGGKPAAFGFIRPARGICARLYGPGARHASFYFTDAHRVVHALYFPDLVATGAVGFIDSTHLDKLLEQGHTVVGYDNLATGRRQFIANALRSSTFEYIEADVLDATCLDENVRVAEIVFHLSANADVRFGI